MILVDSSVWIDYFRDTPTPEVSFLDRLLGQTSVGIPDLVLAEVLQGFQSPASFQHAKTLMLSYPVVLAGGPDAAVQAATNFRVLRSLGVTVRKTIDTLIATRCLLDGHELLFSDRDFNPFVEHLGLRSALRA